MSPPLFVIGAGPGVGMSVARRFGRAGHPVGLVARNDERLASAVESLRAEGIVAAHAVADVRDASAVGDSIGILEEELGPAGALCVSPLPDVSIIKPVTETTAGDLRAALELGVVGTAAAVERVLPSMRAAGRGTLLFTTGSGALTPTAARASSGIVNAAQSTYFRMLREALRPAGIHVVHTVIIGPIGQGGHDPDDIAEAMARATDERTESQVVLR